MSETPSISVVLSTRNRADSLARLLDGLARQVDAPRFEVIVADNGSTDGTPDLLRRGHPGLDLRSVRVDTPGKGRALNAALRLARGELVVFTDDDVEPDPRWLAELFAGAERYADCAVFGGRIDVNRAAVPAWVRRSHNLMGLLTTEHRPAKADVIYGYGRYPFGPNMAVRLERLRGLDRPYPEDMGPGTALPVGDESAFFLRFSPPEATDRRYLAAARVFHAVDDAHTGLGSALRRSLHQGRAQGRLGIPVVPADPNAGGPANAKSFARAALARIRACGSLRELLCVAVRHVGYLQGARLRRRAEPRPTSGRVPAGSCS